MLLGTVLVLAALLLFLYNQREAKQAEQNANAVLQQLTQALPAGSDDASQELPVESSGAVTVYSAMKTVEIDGNAYIGYLSIPALDLKLPVMENWSYEGLKTAPGRYFGSLYTNDLVIAGHNYAHHLGSLNLLSAGTEVDFIDMDNHTWRYKVSVVETLRPEDVETMTMPSDQWDMTLFTCTVNGEARWTIRCVREK